MSAAATTSTPSTRAASLTDCSRPDEAAMTQPRSFVAACASMRSGRDPLKHRDAAVALVREAAGRGAQYVQTPEMTSLVERSRAALFQKIGPQDQDPTLAALREVARERGVMVHVGSIAVKSGEKVANRA